MGIVSMGNRTQIVLRVLLFITCVSAPLGVGFAQTTNYSISAGSGTLTYTKTVSTEGTCPVGSPTGPQEAITESLFNDFAYNGQSLTGSIAYVTSPGGTYCPPSGWQGPIPLPLSGSNYVVFFTPSLSGAGSATLDALTVSASPNSSVYGGAVQFTATEEFPNASGTVTFSDGSTTLGSATMSSDVATYSNSSLAAGGHSITASYTGNSSSVTSPALSFTVNQAPQSITFTAPSSVTYGVSPISLSASGGASGNSVTFSVVSGLATVSGSTLTITGAGPVVVAANQAGNGNYSAAPQKTQSITVNKATLTVTANNSNRAYGSSNPTFTAAYSGFVNGDTSSVLSGTPSLTTSATSSSAAGAYAITAAAGTLTASNYSFSFVNGTLTVGKVTLTVTANNANRTYGASNPAFTAAYSGFVNGDTSSVLSGSPSLTTTANSSSALGTYPITAAAGTLTASNYSFSFVNGTLTVGKATLTVTANNTSRTYEASNPTFTVAYSGFVDGDTSSVLSGSPSLTTTAASTSAPGIYTITAAVGTLTASNYSFSFVNGALTVNKVIPVITWSAPTAISAGTALSGTQLNATANYPGAFTYFPGPGTVFDAGTQTLVAIFTPTNSTDYATVTANVSLVVNVDQSGQNTPVIGWATPASISYGTALSSTQLNATASYSGTTIPGTYEYTPAAGEVLDAGSQTLLVMFFPTDSVHYSPASGSVMFTVNSNPSVSPLPIYSYSITTPGGAASGYAPNSNILNYSDSVMGTWSFNYDSLNRLIAGMPAAGNSINNGNNLCWSYDPFGNRTAQSSQSAPCPTLPSVPTPTVNYNANNQVTGGVLTYDAAGDVKFDTSTGNTYLYDGEGRICAVKSEPVPGTYTMTQYIYDAEGTRVAKGTIANWAAGCNTTTNGFTPTNSYVIGPSGEQMTETDGNGNWIHSNVYAGGMLIATYDMAPTSAPALHFQLEDWLGSRREQTDIFGNPEETYTTLPFGDGMATTIVSGAPPSADDAAENHFTGKERDTESGNDYFGARYYASSMGRFMSPDWSSTPAAIPFADPADPQSLNQYSYVKNNPLNRTDPNGHNWFDVNGQWSWHKGDTWKDGDHTYTSKYTGLLVAQATGTDKKTGATLYNLTLYDQNKAVATGTGFSGGEGHPAVKDGNYMFHLDIRDPAPNSINPNSALGNPPPTFGIQPMHDIEDGQYRYGVVGAYGPMRARLNPTGGAKDDGDYFHGQTNGHGWTHGCLCYGADTRFIDYMWNNMPHSAMPAAIDTPVQKP